ncbi:MAG: flippase-like domain-containing protein [Candidatus Korarchaeum sp.]|nr:flippase-like domain-containing protein [Candidatus Korarchaeum sp.]MDW8035496.1 lysylphosphatidylglycerol synthase transmembrane domain-containing protein [Candidatus Korarchaeum sp.]
MGNRKEIPKIGRKNILLMIVGVVLTIPLLIKFDFRSAMEKIGSIGVIPVILAFASIHIGVLFYNLGWYFLLRRRVKFRDVFLIGWVSLFVNLLIPAASTTGEVARVYLLTRRSDVSAPEALSSIVAHRIIMIAPFIVSITLGSSYLITLRLQSDSAVVVLPVALLIAIFYSIYKISMREDYLEKIIKVFERILKKNFDNFNNLAKEYSKSFRYLISDKPLLLITMLCAFLNWLFDMFPIFIYFWALGHNLNPLLGVLIYSVSIILILIPVGIPGNIGVREWVMTSLLMLVGLSSGEALALTLTSSTMTVFLNELIFGLAAYLILMGSSGSISKDKSF